MRGSVEWPGVWLRLFTYGMRSLRRSPGFTAAAVLTLAVGIAATTAICTVVNAILLRPLPLRDADRLVRIVENERPPNLPPISYGEYLDWRSRTTTLEGLAAATFNPNVVMQTPAGLVRVTAGEVSANYFEVLGARAELGRTLASADANSDALVLGYDAWRRLFASDPGIIGSVVHVSSGGPAGRSLTVIGVLPESMETIDAPMDCFMTIASGPDAVSIRLAQVIGRIRAGTTSGAAFDEANVVGAAVRLRRPPGAPPLTTARFDIRNFKDGLFDPPPGRQGGADLLTIRTVLHIFLGAVTIVLLIVCANVANLLLARGSARQRELATRLALGASRWDLVRQILAECIVLAAAGGTIGAALAAAAVSAIKWLTAVDAQGVFRVVFGRTLLPRAEELGAGPPLFAITFVVAAIATIAFGLLPALRLSRSTHLHGIGSRSVGTTRRDSKIRALLVIGQLALATLLLVAAALLSASFANLAGVKKGYDATNVLAFQLVLPDAYPTARKAESIESVLRAVRAVPGVSTAGFSYAGILIGVQDTVGSFVPSGAAPETTSQERPRLKSLSAGYLESVRATLLDGRLLSDGDSAHAPPVVVINQALRRRYFGEASPVGAFMDWHGQRGAHIPVQVVGVIADVREGALHREPYPEVFMDYRQVVATQQGWGVPARAIDHLAFGFLSFAMQTRGDPSALISSIRQAIGHADPNAALDAIMPLDSLVADSMARQRFYAVMLAAFALVAAALGAVGIYGVLVCFIVERTREIGLRMALGAGRRQVLGLVLGRGLAQTAIGIGLGLALAAAATRFLQSMLYGITPLDVPTFAAVAIGFAAVAAFASYFPALRATRLDPIEALRTE